MTTAEESILTPELRAEILEFETPPRTSLPVDRSAIRMWAINVRWPEPPNRLYWDEAYAKTTRWGGIIAPRNFNPFAYHMEEERAKGPSTLGLLRTGKGRRGMNGGGEATYHAPIRPGDVITETKKVVDVVEKRTSLGPTVFVTSETVWTNQRGELVKIYRGVGIRF